MTEPHTQEAIAAHFDSESRTYDYWKNKNWYYYETLRSIARSHVVRGSSVLDVGCGTGAMLEAVSPARGLGIDISPGMVAIARQRNANRPEYRFETADITRFSTAEKFDTILFFDVIEHVVDTRAALSGLRDALAESGSIVLSMANPLWEPILMLGEKLGMKMPEGPHYRVPAKHLIALAKESGLALKEREWHLLFPKYVPLVSALLNWLGRLPLLRRLCVIEVFVFEKA